MPTPTSAGTVPWPQDFKDAYIEAGYWENRPLGHHLWEQADRDRWRFAVIDGDQRLTYAQMTNRADAAASRLRMLGVRAGDRVLVQLPNTWEFIILTLALLRGGAIPVMALPGHRRHELEYLANHSEAVAIVVPDDYRGFNHRELAVELRDSVRSLRHVIVLGESDRSCVSLRRLLAPAERPDLDRERWDDEPPNPDEVAVFLLSGGTTGLPKLIGRTHNDYAYNAKRSAEVAGVDEETVYLVSLPAGHNFPLACPGILGTLISGGTVVLLDSPEPSRAFETIEAHGVTHTAVVPAVAQKWLDHANQRGADQVGSLKVLQVGGARLADEVARRVAPTLGCTLQQVFGMAEGLLNYTRLDDDAEIITTTQGRPMSPADEVRIVDPITEEPVTQGTPGTLLTRGPYTPRGYYRAEEHNGRAFTHDGWYRSGDVCRQDPNGNLIVEGRDKDIINRGGEKISAEEVENLVYALPDVAEVAAIAMPDPLLGERICIYVVPRQDATLELDDIRAVFRQRQVAAFKFPEHLEVVAEIPHTKVGKIDKKRLREDITQKRQNA